MTSENTPAELIDKAHESAALKNTGRTQANHLWEPGESGNPKGRPKGAKDGIAARLRRVLRQKATQAMLARIRGLGLDPEDATVEQALACSMVANAIEGDVQAAKVVLDRTDGPVVAILDISATVETTSTVTITEMRRKLGEAIHAKSEEAK